MFKPLHPRGFRGVKHVWPGDEILINSNNDENSNKLIAIGGLTCGWHSGYGLVSKQNTGRHGFSLIAASKLAIKGHPSTASSNEISPIVHWNIFHQFLAIFSWFALQQKKGTTAHWFLSYLMLPGSTGTSGNLGRCLQCSYQRGIMTWSSHPWDWYYLPSLKLTSISPLKNGWLEYQLFPFRFRPVFMGYYVSFREDTY